MTSTVRYDLKTGYPDLALVPRQRLHQLATQTLLESASLQYAGDLAGTLRARQQIAYFLSGAYQLPVTVDELIVTTGALHSIDVTARALTSPGDVVVVESPTFYFAVNILQMSRVEIVGVPMSVHGIDLNALEDVLRRYAGRVKIVYTIPTFHNPTGICASRENRQGLVTLAERYHFTILEDATYQPLYFADPPPPILRTYDRSGCVVTAASVSKLVMPALRVGWLLAAPEMIQRLKGAKGDGGTSMFNTELVAAYIESGEFDLQVEAARRFYARKHDLMAAALDRFAPNWLRWDAPNGGYFIWCELPEGLCTSTVHQRALAHGVDFFPGSASYVDGADDRHLRLCFAYLPDDQIEAATAAFCAALAEAE